jgi:Leucine-rich repeat (LRR) protein
MPLLETLTVQLGTAVAKVVLKLWLKDATLAQDVATSFTDTLVARIPNLLERRKVARQFEGIAEEVAERLAPYFEAEYGGLPLNEREAAASAVATALAAASIDESTLLTANLDARALERLVRARGGRSTDTMLLSEAGTRLYDFALRESCDYIVEIATNLPRFTPIALRESLQREDEILRLVRLVLDKLPSPGLPESGQGSALAFETRYRRHIANKLDRLELFGITVSDVSRRYGLSVAYITLSASGPMALASHFYELAREATQDRVWRTVSGLRSTLPGIEAAQRLFEQAAYSSKSQEPRPSSAYDQVYRPSSPYGQVYRPGSTYGQVYLDSMSGRSEAEASVRVLTNAELLAIVRGDAPFGDRGDTQATARVDEALAAWPRTLVRGEAGSGKTTLLQWLAVRSARRSFDGALTSWNNTVPFFIQLRRYAGRDLPAPEAFLEHTARSIAAEMPDEWVHQQLAAGRGLVLVDGLDELPEADRRKAREWLGDLTEAFPHARYIVTSRPPAISGGWLRDQTFAEAELQPMSLSDIEALIDHWHAAAREDADHDERTELDRLGGRLKHTIQDNRPIRSLAANPLLCAMLCALNRDRRTQLPRDRVELYRIALEMLLERRDLEREVATSSGVDLSLPQKQLFLQDLAFWLLLNNRTDAERAEAIARIRRKLPSMPSVQAEAEVVFRQLLVRSGLLREPVEGRVDFVHRTFQEYLGAKEAAEEDHIGLLLRQARSDQWREVIILAAGLGNRTQREALIGGLLAEGQAHPRSRHRQHLLAVACLEAAPALSAKLRAEIRKALADLIPPRTMAEARAVASAGDLAVPLLAGHQQNARIAAACVRALGLIGTEECLSALHGYASSNRVTVVRELLRAWPRFDVKEFARQVLADSPLERGRLLLDDPTLLPGTPLLHHLKELHCSFDSKLTDLVSLVQVGNLVSLQLQGEAANLAPLARHRLLKSLSLESCTARDLSPLSELTALQGLRLSGCSNVADVSPLRKLQQLRSLFLTPLESVEDLAPLAWLERLEELAVGGLERTETLDPLSALRSLRTLALAACMRIADLSPIARLEGLNALQLYQFPLVDDLAPLSRLSFLQHLSLHRLPRVTDLPALTEMTGLRTLELVQVQLSNLRALEDLTGLEHLALSDVPASADLAPLGRLASLNYLYIDNVPELADLTTLGTLQHLQSLTLVNCPQVDDLSPLAELQSLKYLTLESCSPDLDASVISSSTKVTVSHPTLPIDPNILVVLPETVATLDL